MASHLGVVGDPVEHSRSPQLHLAAYEVLNLDWTYERIPVPRGGLSDFVRHLDSSWRGLSVTMPLKAEAMALSHDCDQASSLTGVANTLVRAASSSVTHDGVFRAYNTDISGIEVPIRRLGLDTLDSATIIGGGATASSALVALARLGCFDVHIVLRDVVRSHAVLDVAARLGSRVTIHQVEEIESVPRASLTICTVPGSASLDLTSLARLSGDILFDIAYDVWPSKNAIEWSRRGGLTLSGLTMLAAQALIQVRLFVLGNADDAFDNEHKIEAAMFAAVGLDESGLVVRSVG